MQISVVDNDIILNCDDQFNLKQTFECGQCFRFDEISDNCFEGIAFNKHIVILQDKDKIILKNVSKEDFDSIWKNYFDLDLKYNDIKKELSKVSNNMRQACDFAPGIRILHQDPWEALCSFIISQNNNIPRIKGIVSRFCENFGEHINGNYYAFPKPEVIKDLTIEDLAPLKSGFRAKYIIDAAKKVANKDVDMEKVKTMDIDTARQELQKINGVGTKVAECTLLYGFHRLEAFPIDVWMKRAMQVLFPDNTPKDFGKYAGIAQQYIFHYSRTSVKF